MILLWHQVLAISKICRYTCVTCNKHFKERWAAVSLNHKFISCTLANGFFDACETSTYPNSRIPLGNAHQMFEWILKRLRIPFCVYNYSSKITNIFAFLLPYPKAYFANAVKVCTNNLESVRKDEGSLHSGLPLRYSKKIRRTQWSSCADFYFHLTWKYWHRAKNRVWNKTSFRM